MDTPSDPPAALDQSKLRHRPGRTIKVALSADPGGKGRRLLATASAALRMDGGRLALVLVEHALVS
jgi:hypothetical protein